MDFSAPNNLVTGGRPVFIGWLEQFLDKQVSPLAAGDIESITFSLFRQAASTLGEYSRYMETTPPIPIDGWQEILLDTNKVITEPTIYEPELYRVLALTPFQSNFFYMPPHGQVLFAQPGLYTARFDIVDALGDPHPAEVSMTVR